MEAKGLLLLIDEKLSQCLSALLAADALSLDYLISMFKGANDRLEEARLLLEEKEQEVLDCLPSRWWRTKDQKREAVRRMKREIVSLSQEIRGGSANDLPRLIKKCIDIRSRWRKLAGLNSSWLPDIVLFCPSSAPSTACGTEEKE